MALNLPSPAQVKPSFFSDIINPVNTPTKLPGSFALKRKEGDTKVVKRRVYCSAAHSPQPAWPGTAIPEPSDFKTWDGPKPISVLGSTGSIGTQTLNIVAEFPERFRVVGLAAGSNVTLLAEQVRTFKPQLVALRDESKIDELKEALADVEHKPEIIPGEQGVIEVARHPDAATVVTGIVGCAGLKPTVAAIEAGKDIALANKETMIAGGAFVLPLAHKNNIKILPADSEHSAIFQCIQGLPKGALRKIQLTGSGGAFREWPAEKMKDIKLKDALKHPIWSLGRKITIDSATLFNKGLEVIEAHYLFGAEYDDIEIVIHPQSIIHSLVETQDSSVIAQLGLPDMRLPLLYTLSWPERVYCSEITWPRLDLTKYGSLTFQAPDTNKFPSVNLCYAAGRAGGTMTGVLSAANEIAVELFVLTLSETENAESSQNRKLGFRIAVMALYGRVKSGISLCNKVGLLSSQRSNLQRSLIAPSISQATRNYAEVPGAREAKIKVPIAMFGGSGNYASALYIAAVKTNAVEKVDTELLQFVQMVKGSKITSQFIKDISVKKDVRLKTIQDISSQAKFSDTTKNFLALLAVNGRLKHVELIAKRFAELAMAYKGEVKAIVTTVFPLPPEEENTLKQTVQEMLGSGAKVKLEQKIDPSILGGIVLEFSQKVFDMSIRTRAQQMERILREPVNISI